MLLAAVNSDLSKSTFWRRKIICPRANKRIASLLIGPFKERQARVHRRKGTNLCPNMSRGVCPTEQIRGSSQCQKLSSARSCRGETSTEHCRNVPYMDHVRVSEPTTAIARAVGTYGLGTFRCATCAGTYFLKNKYRITANLSPEMVLVDLKIFRRFVRK